MNHALFRIILAAMLLSPIFASAELIFYKGARRDIVHGGERTLVLNGRFLVVVDYATARVATIFYANVNGQKHYTTSQPTNTRFVQLRGAKKIYTAIAGPPTARAGETGTSEAGVYCSGADALLSLNTNSSISFPKILKSAGSGVSFAPTSGTPFLTVGSYQVTFDRPQTLASNQSRETFAAAFNRLVQHVESLGFTR